MENEYSYERKSREKSPLTHLLQRLKIPQTSKFDCDITVNDHDHSVVPRLVQNRRKTVIQKTRDSNS
jgi:hypothetical protein